MKKFEGHKAYLVFALILGTFISVLPGCGGAVGGGKWDKPDANTKVILTAPANNATGAYINTEITATFSGPMTGSTLASPATSFTLQETVAKNSVEGIVSYSGNTAEFKPNSNLKTNMQYTATITTDAKDLAGKSLASNYAWSFTTGSTTDDTQPTVALTLPLNAATGVFTDTKVTATFSEAMDPATINDANFTLLKNGVTKVSGTVSYDETTKVATFSHVANLDTNSLYTARVTTDAKDLSGNALAAAYSWDFTTGLTADITAPTITNTDPADLATNVAIDKKINITFSKEMSLATMIAANFVVKETLSSKNVQGTVAYVALNSIATFSPTASLTPNMKYTLTVGNGAQDLTGHALVSPAVNGLPKPNPWTFTTAAAVIPPAGALAINLGNAASYGIASRAGLTSTGVTIVNGNIALSPQATCSDATGAPGGSSQTCLTKTYASATGMTVNGSIFYAADPFDSGVTAAAVTTDLTKAWNEGMAKVNTQPAIAAGELGGKTFVPGVYENANLTLMAGGIVTLDAQNDPNAIFIFKTTLGGDLVDSGTLLLPSRIDLKNQAQAKNVWFVVGRDATIGSGTTWNGNILANRTATVLDGATVNGRVLAGAGGAGAITLTGAANPSRTTISVP